jgi:hypothetical protein
MAVDRRTSMIGLGVISVAGATWPLRLVEADDLPPGFTQDTFNSMTQTESSVPGQPPAPTPTPVHNMSKSDVKDLKAAGGKKVVVVDGKDWLHSTPQERDALLRKIDMPAGSRLILSVPTGNLWIVPGDAYDQLKRSRTFDEWTEAEILALGKTVSKDSDKGQDNRRNSSKLKHEDKDSKSK